MANIKTAKKRAKQNKVKRQVNLARKTAIKTAVKNVLAALERDEDIETTKKLLKVAESKLARAKGKKVVHHNTAARKVGRLAKKVAAASK